MGNVGGRVSECVSERGLGERRRREGNRGRVGEQ